MTNSHLAFLLALNHFLGDHYGSPNCCFYIHGKLVAIRTKHDEIVVFHAYELDQRKLENKDLAERIIEESPKPVVTYGKHVVQDPLGR